MATEITGADIMSALRQEDTVILTGGAGTGKTTLIKDVVNLWRAGDRTLCAPTARAARTLSDKAEYPAATVHSTFYKPPQETETGLQWNKVKLVGGRNALIVVDEMSMVGLRTYQDMQRACRPGTKILLVGDQNQLKPVQDKPAVDLNKAHLRLTKVWRSDNGIISAAHAVLACKTPDQLLTLIRNPRFEGVRTENIRTLPPTLWKKQQMDAGIDTMLISHSNELRFLANSATRQRLKYTDPLVPGDMLLVKSNHMGLSRINGELMRYMGDAEPNGDLCVPEHYRRVILKTEDGREEIACYVVTDEFKIDGSEFSKARRTEAGQWRKAMREAGNEVGEMEGALPGPMAKVLHLNYGYCLTCHSAQGGEAPKVGMIWDADWMINKNFEAARAWWYTAITRAQQEVIIWRK